MGRAGSGAKILLVHMNKVEEKGGEELHERFTRGSPIGAHSSRRKVLGLLAPRTLYPAVWVAAKITGGTPVSQCSGVAETPATTQAKV